MTQGTLNLDAPAPASNEEWRDHVINVNGREQTIRLRYVDGVAQPSMPDNESYMRGWNAGRKS